jgi:hypothetical protein
VNRQSDILTSAVKAYQIQDKVWHRILYALLILAGISSALKSPGPLKALIIGIEIIILPIIFLFTPPRIQIKALLVMGFLGIDYPLFLASFFFAFLTAWKIWKNHNFYFPWPVLFLILIFMLAIFLFIINIPIYYSITGLIWWFMTFGSAIFAFFYLLQFRFTEDTVASVIAFFKTSLLIQFPLIIIQAIADGGYRPGDWCMGSFPHAHYLGNYAFLWILAVLFPWLIGKEKFKSVFTPKNTLLSGSLLFLIFLTDSKTVDALILFCVLIFCAIAWIGYQKLNLKYLHKGKLILITLSGAFLFWIAQAGASWYLQSILGAEEANVWEFVEAYILSDESSQKAQLYQRAYSEMRYDSPWQYWVGTGPGTFASRASNTLAYDVLFKDGQKMPGFIPPTSSPYTRKYLSDLWTEEIFLSIGYRSAMLSFPFAGMVSLKAELGWVGLLFYLMFGFGIFWVLVSRSYSVPGDLKYWWLSLGLTWLILLFLMLFDNYQEQTVTMFPLISLTALFLGFTPTQHENSTNQ